MTGKFTVSGSNTNIIFTYTAPTAYIQNVVGACAEYLWNTGYGNHGTPESPILYTSLTNQEKLNLVDEHLRRVVLGCANTFKSVKAQELSMATEEANKYNL
jgi:hypothetical protein